MTNESSRNAVIVPLTRLPENIGRMLNMYLAGDVTALHIIGVTSDGQVINTSTEEILSEVRKYDSFK